MGKERPTGRDLRPCDMEAALLWRLLSLMARRNVGISSLDALVGVEGPAWRRASAASVAAEQAGTELARECPLLGDANEAIVPAEAHRPATQEAGKRKRTAKTLAGRQMRGDQGEIAGDTSRICDHT